MQSRRRSRLPCARHQPAGGPPDGPATAPGRPPATTQPSVSHRPERPDPAGHTDRRPPRPPAPIASTAGTGSAPASSAGARRQARASAADRSTSCSVAHQSGQHAACGLGRARRQQQRRLTGAGHARHRRVESGAAERPHQNRLAQRAAAQPAACRRCVREPVAARGSGAGCAPPWSAPGCRTSAASGRPPAAPTRSTMTVNTTTTLAADAEALARRPARTARSATGSTPHPDPPGTAAPSRRPASASPECSSAGCSAATTAANGPAPAPASAPARLRQVRRVSEPASRMARSRGTCSASTASSSNALSPWASCPVLTRSTVSPSSRCSSRASV